MTEELLTVIEAAKKLSVSPRTIQRYCKQGRLNHKWVQGKRHKELRILSPIPISQLPGGRRRNLASTFDYVTKNDFEELTSDLKNMLDEKDRRIAMLEEETAKMKSIIGSTGGFQSISPDNEPIETLSKGKIETLLQELEKVRPVERKLVLKLAKEIQTHEKYLESLGMEQSENDSTEME